MTNIEEPEPTWDAPGSDDTEAKDNVEYLGKTMIHHGPQNDRVYVMKLGKGDDPEWVASEVLALANDKGYSKIFAKVPEAAAPPFIKRGCKVEARVPKLYLGSETGLFLGCFLKEDRAHEADPEAFEKTRDLSLAKRQHSPKIALPEGYTCRRSTEKDAAKKAALYRDVFESYPFPVFEEEYLIETMRDNFDYFIVENAEGRVLAVASCEKDVAGGNVEMTDFATHPDARGQSLAVIILHEMEIAMNRLGIPTAFTIARALQPGINITFAKCGYEFAGTLVNNTDIGGKLESMNVWYKDISNA